MTSRNCQIMNRIEVDNPKRSRLLTQPLRQPKLDKSGKVRYTAKMKITLATLAILAALTACPVLAQSIDPITLIAQDVDALQQSQLALAQDVGNIQGQLPNLATSAQVKALSGKLDGFNKAMMIFVGIASLAVAVVSVIASVVSAWFFNRT